jgi:hypothetical protein
LLLLWLPLWLATALLALPLILLILLRLHVLLRLAPALLALLRALRLLVLLAVLHEAAPYSSWRRQAAPAASPANTARRGRFRVEGAQARRLAQPA